MQKYLLPLLILFVTLGIAGCSSSKTYSKKGIKLEEAGLYDEAADFYYIALLKNPNNVEAKIGLKSNAQKVVDDKYAKFYQAHGAEQWKSAVYEFTEAEEYRAKIQRFVALDYASYYQQYFDESKQNYLDDLYSESRGLLEEEKFEQAELVLKEIARWDPHFEDVNTLKKITLVEPKYKEAQDFMSVGKYAQAYNLFDEIIEIKGTDYKDAFRLKNEALEKATVRIAILPFENKGMGGAEVSDNFYGKIVQEILQEENEFIRLIDRKNTDKIIEEQKLGMSGLVDEKTAARAGKLLGAQYVLIARITEYELAAGRPSNETKKGYVKTVVRQLNRQTGLYYNTTNWKKTEYQEVQGNSMARASFEYQLISSETGEILTGDVVKVEKSDRIHYATFDGSHQHLFPGSWKDLNRRDPSDQVNTSIPDKQQLDRLLNSRKRNLESVDNLRWKVIEEIADKTAGQLSAFLTK